MKSIPLILVSVLLLWGAAGCESDGDDSGSTVTTVTTNSATGEVQTNVVEVGEADGAAEPAAEPDGASDEPAAEQSVDGRWVGTYEDGVQTYMLSLTLVQDGTSVSGTYSFSDAGSGDILSGRLSGTTLSLGVRRNGILCSITGQVDFNAGTLTGTWADKTGNEGTFSLE